MSAEYEYRELDFTDPFYKQEKEHLEIFGWEEDPDSNSWYVVMRRKKKVDE